MAVLPTGNLPEVTFQQQPGRTWYIDKASNRIRGECSDWLSVRQAVEIILNVERFRWQIYRPYSGMQWDGLIGQDPGYVASELQRRITEALLQDDRITSLDGWEFETGRNWVTARFTVHTIYGDVSAQKEVDI